MSNSAISGFIGGKNALLSPSVPLPGSRTIRRLLNVDIQEFAEAVAQRLDTASLDEGNGDVGGQSSERSKLDELRQHFAKKLHTPRSALKRLGLSLKKDNSLKVDDRNALNRHYTRALERLGLPEKYASLALENPEALARESKNTETYPINFLRELRGTIDKHLTQGLVPILARSQANHYSLHGVSAQLMTAYKPQFFVIEVYGITSFLGEYGTGRTVKTMSLLPGEEVKLRLKTWRSTKATLAQGATIIDSQQISAADTFEKQVQSETTDEWTTAKADDWHISGSIQGKAGLGKFEVGTKVEAGGSGSFASSQRNFTHGVTSALSRHVQEATSARETTITTSSEMSTESSHERLSERTIRNINRRRVLNFVFRELNQEYETLVHLKDIRIAYTTGQDTWREVPISGLRNLLEDIYEAEFGHVDMSDVLVKRVISTACVVFLETIAITFNENDLPVRCLEKVVYDGGNAPIITPEGGTNLEPPQGPVTYRFARKHLEQDSRIAGGKPTVPGVVMETNSFILPTDSVVADALLGNVDALDSFAMPIQEQEVRSVTIDNDLRMLARDAISSIENTETRAKYIVRLLETCRKETEDSDDNTD